LNVRPPAGWAALRPQREYSYPAGIVLKLVALRASIVSELASIDINKLGK